MMGCLILLEESMSSSKEISKDNSQEGELNQRILINSKKFRGTISITCGIGMI